MFVIILILLLLIKLLHIYFSNEILINIDDYILVYNYLKNNCYINNVKNKLFIQIYNVNNYFIIKVYIRNF